MLQVRREDPMKIEIAIENGWGEALAKSIHWVPQPSEVEANGGRYSIVWQHGPLDRAACTTISLVQEESDER
jgi:hypothetical protein